MTSVATFRRVGINSGAAIKVACICASTGNLTLSGEQTVDGIALVDGDRVFAKDQTDLTEIGIYKVSTGAWTREPDFDGAFDVREGTIVPVSRGTANGDTFWRITNTGTITIGTTSITVDQSLVTIALSSTSVITDESTDTTCFPVFVTSATGNLELHTVSGLTFNSATGEISAAKVSASGDTAAGDNSSMGYTATEGLILTGQGSTNDVTIKNDADTDVITIPTGTTNIVIGGGLKFPATQIPSADVNMLDDYEEGTWTPILGGTTTYTLQAGLYTKIGRMVFFSGRMAVNSIGTGSTTVISGLPFTSISTNITQALTLWQWASLIPANITNIVLGVLSGTTTIGSAIQAATGDALGTTALFQDGSNIQFSGFYMVD